MSSVHIRDVRKSFGGFEVLPRRVDTDRGRRLCRAGRPLRVRQIDLLRMLAGLENITSGTISIGDRVVNNIQPKEARHRHGVPELCALSAYDGRRQHGIFAQAARGERR